eukprot:m.162698 g.162698  ORF g.162698 m.162698 type:complete len:320 (-) comp14378_c0_seq7:3329-4288(-)
MQTVASKTPASVADANTPPKQGDSHQPILVGNLSKRAQGRSTFGRTNWKTRWFALFPKYLSYWTHEGGRLNSQSECKGIINVNDMHAVEQVSYDAFGKAHMFQIVHTSVLYVQCATKDECTQWVDALRHLCASNEILHPKYHPGFHDGTKWSCCDIPSKDYKGCLPGFDYGAMLRQERATRRRETKREKQHNQVRQDAIRTSMYSSTSADATPDSPQRPSTSPSSSGRPSHDMSTTPTSSNSTNGSFQKPAIKRQHDTSTATEQVDPQPMTKRNSSQVLTYLPAPKGYTETSTPASIAKAFATTGLTTMVVCPERVTYV